MTQQTAVEWLYDRFLFAGYAVNPKWKEQAKEMEKEQIIKAHIDGQPIYSCQSEKAEQYYNETYKK